MPVGLLALKRSNIMRKWTRRGFITAGVVSGAALMVGIGVRPGHRVPKLKKLVAEENEALVNAWVKITPDNRVIAIVPHCEMGQGVHTSLPMMLAEELDADWSSVEVMEAPDDIEYANYGLTQGYILGNADIPEVLVPTVNGAFLEITQLLKLQITGGSLSVRTTGVIAMRMAGATARSMLIKAASAEWLVHESEISTEANHLIHKQSNRKATFAQFAAKAAEFTPPSSPKLKKPSEYKIVGTSKRRLDLTSKLDGSAGFGIDIDLPDMVYAAVNNAPVFGSRLISVDTTKFDKQANSSGKGVSEIITLDSAVISIASSYWQADKNLKRIKVEWSEVDASKVSSATIFKQFGNDLMNAVKNDSASVDFEKGNAKNAMRAADIKVDSEYRQPFLAHATMEPLNCTAVVKNGFCEVWTGSQNPLGFRAEIADALDMDLDKVKVNNQYLGGGFGRRAIADYAIQAAVIASKLNKPVKLIWSREEDTQQDHYRQACISRFQAGLDSDGKVVAWANQYVDKHEPVEAPHIPYNIPNQQIDFVDSPTHVPFGPWRSVDHSLHAFFTESFIDELAVKTNTDPFEFRDALLTSDKRMQTLLRKVAALSKWKKPLPKGWGRGIAIHRSFGSIVAQVAEVGIEKLTNGNLKPVVKQVYCAVDCGLAINPDGLVAQMEGGIVYGLTAALYGEITLKNGAVEQSNFDDYEMLRMDASPNITVEIVNSGNQLGGAGEPGTPPIMAAVANAIYDATGQRCRSIPFKLS